jgi:hypothetical protein
MLTEPRNSACGSSRNTSIEHGSFRRRRRANDEERGTFSFRHYPQLKVERAAKNGVLKGSVLRRHAAAAVRRKLAVSMKLPDCLGLMPALFRTEPTRMSLS